MAKQKFATPYENQIRVQLTCNDPSRTQQSFQKECDINSIMGKYQKTGLVTHVAKYNGNYQDLPSEIDYHSSLNAILAANESFDSLPSSIRNRFNNDPAEFLEFVDNPENEAEQIELGLMTQPASSNQNEPTEGAENEGSPEGSPSVSDPEKVENP